MLTAAIAVVSIFPFANRASAQDGEPTPVASPAVSAEKAKYNELKKELDRKKEIALKEAEIAEARKRINDAMPQPKASPPTGSATVTGDDIAADIVVYEQLGKALERAALSIKGSVPRDATIIIFDSTQFADWAFYKRSLPLFKMVLDELGEDYCRVASAEKRPPTGNRFGVAGIAGRVAQSTNLVGQFADLLSYFKVDTTTSIRNVAVSEDAVVAAFFPLVAEGTNISVLYPKSFPIDPPLFCGEETALRPCCKPGPEDDCKETRSVYCSQVARSFEKLYRARQIAFEARKEDVNLKRLEQYFAEFLKLFSSEPVQNIETALKKYINAEQFATVADVQNTFFLEIKTVKASGATRQRKNLFFLTDKIDYSGGVIVQWTLYTSSGRIRSSGIESSFDGFRSAEKIRPPKP